MAQELSVGSDIFPSFSPAEYRRRYDAVREEMAARGLDGLVIYGDSGPSEHNMANIHYLTNYSAPWFCYVLFPASGELALLIPSELHFPHARRMSRVPDTEGVTRNYTGRLVSKLKEMGLERGCLGLVGPGAPGGSRSPGAAQQGILPYDHVQALHEGLPQASFQEASEVLQGVRRIKSQEEIAWMRRGAELTDLTVYALEEQAREGMAEYELGGIIASAYMSKEGGWPKTIYLGSTSMHSPDIVFPRQKPSTRVLRKGDVVLLELSAGYWQYAGQIQRCIAVGEAPTPGYQELFDVASEVYHRIVDTLGPGKTDEDVRRAASLLKERGYWTFDGLLHGWGLTLGPPGVDVPEVALIQRPQNPVTFEPGMTVVVQPNVLSSDKRRGLQVGGLILITESGAEPLQKYPMKFITV
ncbi:MAG: M24 family metallopeptidase [Dehalococcoidia bacterium]